MPSLDRGNVGRGRGNAIGCGEDNLDFIRLHSRHLTLSISGSFYRQAAALNDADRTTRSVILHAFSALRIPVDTVVRLVISSQVTGSHPYIAYTQAVQ